MKGDMSINVIIKFTRYRYSKKKMTRIRRNQAKTYNVAEYMVTAYKLNNIIALHWPPNRLKNIKKIFHYAAKYPIKKIKTTLQYISDFA